METIGAVQGQGKKWFVKLKINGGFKRCQLDLGATCNVMSIENKLRLAPNVKFSPSNTKLVLYSGVTIHSFGIFRTECEIKGKTHKLEFEIVRSKQRLLLSGSTSQHLGLMQFTVPQEILKVDHSRTKTLIKEQLIHKYENVFNGPIEALPGEVHFDLDDSVAPVQSPPCNVRVALKEAVKAQLDMHERGGHLVPI